MGLSVLAALGIPSAVAAELPGSGERCETYHGRVVRGQAFQQPIGDGLVFRLAPDSLGWTIGVIKAGRPEEDFAAIATPPYRGINPRYLEGWHFRNRANSGPNEGDVNAPQEERAFAFVLTPEDYRTAVTNVETLLWGTRTDAERQRALDALAQVSRARGTLRVINATLGNLAPGTQAWFEALTFDVELCRP